MTRNCNTSYRALEGDGNSDGLGVPGSARTMSFVEPDVASSFAMNGLGRTIYELTRALRPRAVVEFGVLHGYSLLCLAQGIRDGGGEGSVIGYDLWDEYPYNHGRLADVEGVVEKMGCRRFVTLRKMDFNEWLLKPETFDLFHLDVSNDGDILERVVRTLKGQLNDGAVMLFEGGTPERDAIAWMQKYARRPIGPVVEAYGCRIVDSRFPGLSAIDRKGRLRLWARDSDPV